jgi:CheY-like chemotaxis protein
VEHGELSLLKAELSEARLRSEDQLGALKEEIAQIQRAKDILLSSLEADYKTQIRALEDEIRTLRVSAAAAEAKDAAIKDLTALVDTLKAQPPPTPIDVPSRPESEPAAASALAVLRAENLALTTRIQGAEEELTRARRHIIELREQTPRRDRLDSPDAAIKQELEELRASRDALLTSARDELQKKVAETEARLNATAATAAEAAQREIESLREELSKAHADRDSSRETAARATANLEAEKERSAQQIIELERTIADCASQLGEQRQTQTVTTEELKTARTRVAELEREVAESSQFAQTAAREFKEILRRHDELAAKLSDAQGEMQRSTELLQAAQQREAQLETSFKTAQREALHIRTERDSARDEADRLNLHIRDQSSQLNHSLNDILQKIVAEVAARLNRLLRIFYQLPDIRPESPVCRAMAAARTAAEDLLNALECIYEFWLMESAGLALQRENFPLRTWLSRTNALYEFKAAQRDLTFHSEIDPQIPETILTDGPRLTSAIMQTIDYLLETTTTGGSITFAARVLRATTREAAVSFEMSAPWSEETNTIGQQLSLTVAERIVKLLGGELRFIETPGDNRHITVTAACLRGGAPAPSLTPRVSRRIPRDDIAPLPIVPSSLHETPFPESIVSHPGLDRDFSTDVDEEGMVSIPQAAPPPATGEDRIVSRAPHPVETDNPLRGVESPAAADAPHKIPPPRVEAPPRPEEPSDNTQNLRVLLAEDNRLNQRMIGDILRSRGYVVVIVADGREALTHLTTARFDLALIDCEMPTMDGYAAAREVRKAEVRFGRHTPIFAMTVYLDDDIQRRCSLSGMDELLTKPVRAEQLFQLIDRYFPQHRS